MINRIALAAASILLAAGCTTTTVDKEAELDSLRRAAAAYHEAASSKAADRVVAMYDDAPVMVPPNADLVQGREGVNNYRFGFIETPGVELEFELMRAEVSDSGDMGWTLAIGDITIAQPDGPPGKDQVRDFHTWRKQADGSWKVVVDIWNSGVPAVADSEDGDSR